jgi:hypothetical protein
MAASQFREATPTQSNEALRTTTVLSRCICAFNVQPEDTVMRFTSYNPESFYDEMFDQWWPGPSAWLLMQKIHALPA